MMVEDPLVEIYLLKVAQSFHFVVLLNYLIFVLKTRALYKILIFHYYISQILVGASCFLAFRGYEQLHPQPIYPRSNLNRAFDRWAMQGGDFEELEQALKERPALETRFGALIADKFIVKGEGALAEQFAQAVFQRVAPDKTYFGHLWSS